MKLLSAYKNVPFVLILFLVIILKNTVSGQTIIAVQDFETTPATPTLAITTGTPTYFTGSSATGDRPASTPFYFGGARAWGETNTSKVITFADQSLAGFTGCYVEYKLSSFSIGSTGNGADGADIVTTEISVDGGATYFSTLRVLGNANAYGPIRQPEMPRQPTMEIQHPLILHLQAVEAEPQTDTAQCV